MLCSAGDRDTAFNASASSGPSSGADELQRVTCKFSTAMMTMMTELTWLRVNFQDVKFKS